MRTVQWDGGLELMICPECGVVDMVPTQIPRPDTIHHAELRCPECCVFLGWQPKPGKNAKWQLEQENADLRRRLGEA